MKRVFIVLLALFISFPLFAQQRTGNIYGTVVDQDGTPLPGVTVRLTGSRTAPESKVTNVEGIFRFLSLDPAPDYSLEAALQGFKTLTRGNLIVEVGKNTEITLSMEIGKIEEEVTVTAASPVVQAKKTTISQTINRDVLQSLPSARDIWVMLETVPGVQMDRENVGGSDSGQMSGFMTKGSTSQQWSIDGAQVDSYYFDFDSFEEMSFTSGAADVTQQGSGIGMYLVTRRGGNKTSFGGRFYYTDKEFQSTNLTDELKKEGVKGTNQIREIKDYGFNLGGPLFRDKAWFWISYGIQDIWTNTILNVKDDTLLKYYVGKLNLQILPQNKLELYADIGNKIKFGRDSTYSFPNGYYQTTPHTFGEPMFKIEDQHMVGDDLLFTVRYSVAHRGMSLIPMDDLNQEKLARYDETAGIYRDSYTGYRYPRSNRDLSAQALYYNDKLFGASHEFKIGFQYYLTNNSTIGGYSGNVYFRYNYNSPTVDITGDNKPDLVPGIQLIQVARGTNTIDEPLRWAGYFSDVISFGRFNMNLGFRYDWNRGRREAATLETVVKDNPVWQKNFTTAAADAINRILPSLNTQEVKAELAGKCFSPRFGFTYDMFGDGKTIAKLSLALYRDDQISTSWYLPTGVGGYSNYWWQDNNKNGVADVNELFWRTSTSYALHRVFDDAGNFIGQAKAADGIMWGGYDINNPQKVGDRRYTVDPDISPRSTWEAIFTVERELSPNFGVAVDFSYRRYSNYVWSLAYDPVTQDKEDQGEYVQIGTIPSQVGTFSTDKAAGKPYYLLKAGVPYRYPYYVEHQPDFHRNFLGLEFRFDKRLSNKWMMNASVSLQDQRNIYGAGGLLNPTNLWAIDNKAYAPAMGSGNNKINAYVFSRWFVKVSGLYQLPFDSNVSMTFIAREGHIIPEQLNLSNTGAPNPYSRTLTVYTNEFGNLRLPTFYKLDLRLEKLIRMGETGKIYLIADVFNATNNNVLNRRYDKNPGTYYFHNNSLVKNLNNYMANEVLSPRIFRFGCRFEF